MQLAAVLLPLGLFAWVAFLNPEVHWAMGLAIFIGAPLVLLALARRFFYDDIVAFEDGILLRSRKETFTIDWSDLRTSEPILLLGPDEYGRGGSATIKLNITSLAALRRPAEKRFSQGIVISAHYDLIVALSDLVSRHVVCSTASAPQIVPHYPVSVEFKGKELRKFARYLAAAFSLVACAALLNFLGLLGRKWNDEAISLILGVLALGVCGNWIQGRPRKVLRIHRDRLEICGRASRFIPWQEIASARIEKVSGETDEGTFLALRLSHPIHRGSESGLEKKSWRHDTTNGDLRIEISDVSIASLELLDIVRKHLHLSSAQLGTS
jgi:hypothetical protein